MSTSMNSIIWPEGYLPGFTDNFASNEVIVAGLMAADIWPFLSNATLWPSYYANSANIRFYQQQGPELAQDMRFYFETFGFPVEAECNVMNISLRPQASRGASPGMAGQAKAIHGWMCIMPGW